MHSSLQLQCAWSRSNATSLEHSRIPMVGNHRGHCSRKVGERVNEIKKKKKKIRMRQDQADSRLVHARVAVTPAFLFMRRSDSLGYPRLRPGRIDFHLNSHFDFLAFPWKIQWQLPSSALVTWCWNYLFFKLEVTSSAVTIFVQRYLTRVLV